MNSKERIFAAMDHKTPDRVPVMCQLALGHYFLNCDYKPSEIWFDNEIFTKALVELQQEYGFDGILVNLPGRPPDWKKALKSYKRIDNQEHLYWTSGLETIFSQDDNPQTFRPGQIPLRRADYHSVDINDPATYRLTGYVWNTCHAPELWDIDPNVELSDPSVYPNWFTNTLRAVQQLTPDTSIHAEVFSPFTHLMELFGYEQAMLALVDFQQKCHDALGVFTRNVLAQVELYAECQPDAILISSAFAGAGFISRRMYEEFVVPYEDRIFQAIRRHGLKSYVHTCGAIGDRLDIMSKTAVDGIDTLDPPPLGTVNLEDAKSKYGERFFFKGNLDAVNEMLNVDEKTFEQAVKERIEIGKPGSGYILSSACSVAPYVMPERLKYLVKLATQFGKYES
jgi:uroporphyrinogen-III decarboxylase